MRIQLPSPDYGTVGQWFAQMRIVLKAAEKVHQEMVKDLGEEADEDNLPWLHLGIDDEMRKSIDDGKASGEGVEEDIGSSLFIVLGRP